MKECPLRAALTSHSPVIQSDIFDWNLILSGIYNDVLPVLTTLVNTDWREFFFFFPGGGGGVK